MNVIKHFNFQLLNAKAIFNKGQKVQQEFGGPIMVVIGFEPELIENVITEWQDDLGNVLTGKFMEDQLETVNS